MRRLLCFLLVMMASQSFSVAVAGPAIAQPTATARLRSLTATIIARGAALQFGIVYSCSKTTTSNYLYLRVTEGGLGEHVAQGSGSSDTLKCDGIRHTTNLLVVTENSFAFHKGVGLAQGTLTACDAVPACATVPFNRTIVAK